MIHLYYILSSDIYYSMMFTSSCLLNYCIFVLTLYWMFIFSRNWFIFIYDDILVNFIFCVQSNPNQFWSRFIPVSEGGQIYATLTAISPTPTLLLAWFKAPPFSKPTLLHSFSTTVFHVFFGCPPFLLPFTSNCNAFLKTCLYHPSLTHARTISLHSPWPSEPSVQ